MSRTMKESVQAFAVKQVLNYLDELDHDLGEVEADFYECDDDEDYDDDDDYEYVDDDDIDELLELDDADCCGDCEGCEGNKE